MSSSKTWNELFDIAYNHYWGLLHSIKSPEEKMEHIRRFIDVADEFRYGGVLAKRKIVDELESLDNHRCNVALRIVIEINDVAILADVNRQILAKHHSKYSTSNLLGLWDVVEPPFNSLRQYTNEKNILRFPIARSVLREQSNVTEKIASELLETDDDALKEVVVNSVASWNDSKLLWNILDKSDRKANMNWWDIDIRDEIAFHLALQGQEEALQILSTDSRSDNPFLCAHACEYLSLLSMPTAIPQLKRLVQTESAEVLAFILDASSNLKAGNLIDDLILISYRKVRSELFETLLCDEAIRTLRYILGESGNTERYVASASQEIYTDDYRSSEIDFYRLLARQLDSNKRYCGGELLTLQHLCDELQSPHEGIVMSAIYNLRAISGKSFGFELNKDLIANHSAVKAWNKYASQAQFYSPGEWFYFGKPISNISQ